MGERTAADGVCEPVNSGQWSTVTFVDEDWRLIDAALRVALHSDYWRTTEAEKDRLRGIILAMRVPGSDKAND
jgi:hypothetical protein